MTQSNNEAEYIVEKLKFWSNESGFAIIQAKNQSQQITITGKIPYECHPGERIFCIGEDVIHPTYGRQFACTDIRIELPNTEDGILKFLQSNKLKGIGKGYAQKIMDKFGKNVFKVLKENPDKFLEIEGLGKKRLKQLVTSWLENESIYDVTCFLQSHGLGMIRSEKVFKHYGDQAVKVIRENPYQLIEDIDGFGFKLADQLAQSLGLNPESSKRIAAGIKYVLEDASHSGHTYLTLSQTVDKAYQLMELSNDKVMHHLNDFENSLYKITDDKIYLLKYELSESYCAKNLVSRTLRTLTETERSKRAFVVSDFLSQAHDQLTTEQTEAIIKASENFISLLTGGPGVGKTTTVRAIIRCFESMDQKVLLAAPTGRAAKRLEESSGRSASTIHRMLEFDPNTGSFKHNEQQHLKADFIIIDEVSMVDITLLHHLLKAISINTGLLLVGDPDQLPSVGPGAVLRDCINSERFEKTHLTQIFRQANQSLIVKNAYRVKEGEFPIRADTHSDFITCYQTNINDCLAVTLQTVDNYIAEGYDLLRDIQILTPMHKGELGTFNINKLIQQKLCGKKSYIRHQNNIFYIGDKVVQLQNDYDKGVFNGDIGWIEDIDHANSMVYIAMSGRQVIYPTDELDQLQLAYATSIHKSQGSEYPIVILCLSTAHYMLLSRKLVYTAITRAKKQVILVAQPKSIALTLSKAKLDERQTQLGLRICEQH